MTATTHTPTPWYTLPGSRTVAGPQHVIHAHGSSVGEVFAQARGLGEANAAFIVTACNAHDELVAALREIVEFDRLETREEVLGMRAIARAALAKVVAP